MGKYNVKCDVCKKTIKTTDNVVESYQGGMCKKCRADSNPSLMDAIKSKDKRLMKNIDDRMKKGEMIKLWG